MEVPIQWKTFKVIPIHKLNKDKNAIENYRPLTMVSTTCKIINRLIKNRVKNFTEENKILPIISFGFRKGNSTQHCILSIINHIINNKNKNMNTVAIIIDLEKVFDHVDNKILLMKMRDSGINYCFVEWIQNFLMNRNYIIENYDSSCSA